MPNGKLTRVAYNVDKAVKPFSRMKPRGYALYVSEYTFYSGFEFHYSPVTMRSLEISIDPLVWSTHSGAPIRK
jgi:hypothetical protein